MTDWTTPTTWDQRFRDALNVMCGEPPPAEMVEAWFEPGCDSMELQHWVAEKARMPWAQGIVVIDAAEMLANSPAEGHQESGALLHADRKTPNTTDEPPASARLQSWADARRGRNENQRIDDEGS